MSASEAKRFKELWRKRMLASRSYSLLAEEELWT
jgi:hypothetical protein